MDTTSTGGKQTRDYAQNKQPRNSVDALFPLPRYFQVHFEHIHNTNSDVQMQVSQLNRQVDEVNAKLNWILKLLVEG